MLKAELSYDNGTILIRGLAHVPFATLDPRNNVQRAPAMNYTDIIKYLDRSEIQYIDHVLDLVASPNFADTSVRKFNIDEKSDSKELILRVYQQRAIRNWLDAGKKGCIVMPTGSGKTIVGIRAIEIVNSATLVVVPTIDLMEQWTSILAKHFGDTKIGNIGGGMDQIGPITVSTYDSAYLRAPILGNKFQLVIFDEVHHLAAPGYRSIAEQMACRFRLGLTATIEREDNMHTELPKLVGGVVYVASTLDLANQKHIAQYQIERRRVQLLPEEMQKYQQYQSKYHSCLQNLGVRMNYPGAFQRLIVMSTRNNIAREAILAKGRAISIALNSRAKIDELREILSENKGIKTIIFTQHNSIVHEISDIFLIPFITHKTPREERQDILKGFREGRYSAIVTSKVLDEGIDVPEAELGIIISGTGSTREFIQRLGRLLRPKQNMHTHARLIEIVSSGTGETSTSAKRKKGFDKAMASSAPFNDNNVNHNKYERQNKTS